LRKEHFENLLGHPPVIHQHPLHIETNDFTEDALINSIELLKTNKSGLTGCYSCGSTKNVLLTKKNSVKICKKDLMMMFQNFGCMKT